MSTEKLYDKVNGENTAARNHEAATEKREKDVMTTEELKKVMWSNYV